MWKATPGLLAWFACLAWTITASAGSEPNSEDETFFETRIRPVLAESCIECHGPKKSSGGLRLDSQAAMAQGGDSGAAIDSEHPEVSLLIRAVRRDSESPVKMPPDQPLSSKAVSDLTDWIQSGAKWPKSLTQPIPSNRKHWAFEPLQKTSIPYDESKWATEPIDCFIAAARRSQNLHPVGPADKSALIRRAYYDLTGLPPSPREVQQFMEDPSDGAFAKVVDTLLASQRYGERWGRHWLDLVRYADTAGDNADYPIPQAYLYRDYVIDAFNTDLPFDRFLHEQLAGDILAKHAPESDYARLVIATGFIAQSKRIGTRELEDMHLIIEDTLTTLGPAFMGLSLRCARCHDHKFEPISMDDYYALYGFFASTQYPFAGAEEVRKQTKFPPLVPPAQVNHLIEARNAQLAMLQSEIEQLETGKQAAESSSDRLPQLKQQLAALEKADPLEGVATAYAVSELQPVDVPVQTNGNPAAKKGKLVKRGVPKALDEQSLAIPDGTSGRLEFARWMTTNAGHLTARVFVNRVWQHHFGKPLVATPSDFGLRGAAPTHPELLDWLAQKLIDSDWSVKALHRAIMLSKTYQLSSELDVQNSQIDSGNMWYWRFDRRRLDAESLRDSILLLGGTLDLSRPGPHPFPEPKKWRYTAHHQFNDVCYPSNHRSVYLMVQRLHAHPYLSLFNGADPSLSTASRDNSTVPLQALYLLNNSFVHEQAEKLAGRILVESNDMPTRINSATLQVYCRPATIVELERWTKFINAYQLALADEGLSEDAREHTTWSAVSRSMLASNEFFFLD